MTISATQGFGFDGGHFEDHGLSENGNIIHVPVHRHEISMDISDLQFAGRYAFGETWFGEWQVPVKIRDQSTEIVALTDANGNEPSTEEFEAMLRNGDVHHRSETYSGLGDFRLMVGRQSRSLLNEHDLLLWSAGLTVPLGSTEDDPWVRGAAGLRHNHIQLGNGTFDPTINLQYLRPISESWSAIATTSGRFPLYENEKTFRGPLEGSLSGRALYRPHEAWTFDAGYQLAVQGYAHWDGNRDDNTGLLAHTFELGAASQLGATRLRLGALIPMATQLFLDDSDGFEPGPSVSFSVTRTGG